MPRRGVNSTPERGFALLIVFWSLPGLALLFMQLVGSERVQLRMAATVLGRAMAEVAAEGALRQGIFLTLRGTWNTAANQPLWLNLGGVTVRVVAEDEAMKINPKAANRWFNETYIAEHNKKFAIAAEQEGSAFVADAMGAWREILCVQEERTVGNDNTVKWQRLNLQLPPSRLRPHFVKANVRVHEDPDGELAVYCGHQCNFTLGPVRCAKARTKMPRTARVVPPTA
jgi:hypothetical protein